VVLTKAGFYTYVCITYIPGKRITRSYVNRNVSGFTHCVHGLATGLLRIKRRVARGVWRAIFKTILKFATTRRYMFCFTPKEWLPHSVVLWPVSGDIISYIKFLVVELGPCENYIQLFSLPFTYLTQITRCTYGALLGYHVAFLGFLPLKMGQRCFPETSVRNYHHSLRKSEVKYCTLTATSHILEYVIARRPLVSRLLCSFLHLMLND
jgi:hypothetical protein